MTKPRIFLLAKEPEEGSRLSHAFDALDDAFGTEPITTEGAIRVMKENHLPEGSFDSLCFGGYIIETYYS